MNRIKIFTHSSDIDGLGSVILGKLAWKKIEYELFPDPQNLKEKFKIYIETGKLKALDRIYITDLALYDPALEMVNNNEYLKNKVLIFDHHKGAIDAHCDRYGYTNIRIKDDNGIKECGTKLFYEYLYQNNFINRTSILDFFVELVRLEDTWEWGKYGEQGVMAHDLAILFNSISKEEYIDRMVRKLTDNENNNFYFDEKEMQLIQNKKDETVLAIEKALDEIEYFNDEFGNKFGIVFANYEFRNEIPEHIRKIGNPEKIKYIIIAAMDKGETGQKSYRVIENGFNVNEIAKLHGGGGHASAAAVAITLEQKNTALSLPKRDGLEFLYKSKYE